MFCKGIKYLFPPLYILCCIVGGAWHLGYFPYLHCSFCVYNNKAFEIFENETLNHSIWVRPTLAAVIVVDVSVDVSLQRVSVGGDDSTCTGVQTSLRACDHG